MGQNLDFGHFLLARILELPSFPATSQEEGRELPSSFPGEGELPGSFPAASQEDGRELPSSFPRGRARGWQWPDP